MNTFAPSPYQQAIFDWIQTGSGSLIVDAKAGSGKTTTVVQGLEFIPASETVVLFAFNKAIADELKGRVTHLRNVEAKTFHSAGMSAWLRHCKPARPDVNGAKTWDILKKRLGDHERDIYGSFVANLVSLAKQAGVGYLRPNTEDTWWTLVEHFGLYLDSDDDGVTEDRAIEIARKTLEHSNAIGRDVIDFDDMLYLPLINNLKLWQHDWVIIDEAQDTNPVRRALAHRALKKGGRLIAVGDPNQAIYGFTGADSNAMNIIATDFSAVTLPLSVSYRCPLAVVEAAQEFVPDIEAFEGAKPGLVEDKGTDWTAKSFLPTDVILCRNVAPMVGLAYKLLTDGVACRILGREIGQGLIKLIDQMGTKDLDSLITKLDVFLEREVAKFTSKGQENRAQAVTDRVDCVLVFIEQLTESDRTVQALRDKVLSMFSEKQCDILTLATCHKSKGMEWDRVWLYERHTLMPSPWVQKAWQKEQEDNLIYVAYTRSMNELYFFASREA